MQDLMAQREKLLINAADCEMIAHLACDEKRGDLPKSGQAPEAGGRRFRRGDSRPRREGRRVRVSDWTRGLLAVLALDTAWVVGVAVMLLAFSTLFQ